MSYNNEDINIVYSTIVREKHTILSEYTECSGNFSQIIEQIIKEVIMNFKNPPIKYRTYFYYGKYAIFLIKYIKVYIIIMFPNEKINNTEIVFSLLYCLFEKLKLIKDLNLDKIGKMRPYSLKDFSSVLKEQINKFSLNSESFISYLKSSSEFLPYELEDRNFEANIQLPILSNIQVHRDKTRNNEEIKEEIKEEPEISFRNTYNSILTQDSFKDDILKQDKTEKLIEEDNNDLIINKDKNDDEFQKFVLKEKERTGKNKAKKKILIIIIIIILVILAAASLGFLLLK